MGRNIFNQPQSEAKVVEPPALSAPKSAKLPGSVGGLRDSLREITANSIRDIEPDSIEIDGLRDRLILEDSSIDELAESIRKHGQQVPIMVRPSDRPDRYRIVYGRRRLAAIRKIGGTVKAIVRTLDDDASLIAQGQENNLRLDPSFIEKALFIRDMQSEGYKPAVIQDALGLSRQGVSNHRVVVDQLQEDLIRIIGPAHGVGRRQWSDLASLSGRVPLTDLARDTLAALPEGAASSDKFKAVFTAAQKVIRGTPKRSATAVQTALNNEDGTPLGSLTHDGHTVDIKIMRKEQPEFGQWIEANAEAVLRSIFDQWQKESGKGS
jgi:ParB family transcriptional regulator, chromosome partitioning protein